LVLDFLHPGFVSFLQGMARSGLGLFVYGVTCPEFLPSVLDFVHTDLSSSLRSFSYLGLMVFPYGII